MLRKIYDNGLSMRFDMSTDPQALARQLLTTLNRVGWTLATAESCTGGLVGHWVTEVPGSSAAYLGGVQAYSNSVKIGQLGVDASIIAEYGAVSEPCAMAMAERVRGLLGTDLGVSVTGIAGPSGGTSEKPTGLVFCAVAGAQETLCTRNIWTGNRSENKHASAVEALKLLLRYTELHGKI